MISAFICLNLVSTLFMNRPEWLREATDEWIHERLDPMTAWRLDTASWVIRFYAYLLGFDNRWEMFSYAHRSNWSYLFQAKYSDGRIRALPLPGQSERTFLQEHVFDFREAKFHLNIYKDADARWAYARYLCRSHGDSAAGLESIIVELRDQELLERTRALAAGTHLEAEGHSRVLDVVSCG